MGIQFISKDNRVEEFLISNIDYAIVETSGDVTVYIQGETKKLKKPLDLAIIESYFEGRVLHREKHFYLIGALTPEEIKDLLDEQDSPLRKELSTPK
jgi:hypothetical protein